MNTTPKIVRMKNVIQNLKHLTFILTTISYFAPLCDQGQSSSSLIKALEHFFQLKKKKRRPGGTHLYSRHSEKQRQADPGEFEASLVY